MSRRSKYWTECQRGEPPAAKVRGDRVKPYSRMAQGDSYVTLPMTGRKRSLVAKWRGEKP